MTKLLDYNNVNITSATLTQLLANRSHNIQHRSALLWNFRDSGGGSKTEDLLTHLPTHSLGGRAAYEHAGGASALRRPASCACGWDGNKQSEGAEKKERKVGEEGGKEWQEGKLRTQRSVQYSVRMLAGAREAATGNAMSIKAGR